MGKCFSSCICSGEDDHHHQSSPSPARRMSAEAGTITTNASMRVVRAPISDTSLSMASVISRSSGSGSPANSYMADVSDTSLSMGSVFSRPAGSGSPAISYMADVSDTSLSMASVFSRPAGSGSPATSYMADISDTSLSMGSVFSRSAGSCSPAISNMADISDTSLSMGSVFSRSAGSCSPFISSLADVIPEACTISCATSSGIPNTTLSTVAVASGSSGHYTYDIEPTGFDADTISCDTELNMSSFIVHRLLGQGGFGQVVLATNRNSQQTVAIKSVDRDDDYETERYVLEQAQGYPFLIQLYTTFQTCSSFYFVMEYVCGGDLHDFIQANAPLDKDGIKFIVGEITCGLQYLHGLGILHRDIKPGNILMDDARHIRIADFGLAAVRMYGTRTKGIAGTPGYMAPEVINNDFYQFEPDWFSLGVITYELATKRLPFVCGTMEEYWSDVTFYDPNYPPDMDPHLEDFIEGLLRKYPDDRLGIKDNIRSHVFMDGINWEDLEEGKISPPF